MKVYIKNYTNYIVIWGGFSVNNATLNRFFALHFVLPFVLAALALMHLIALHDVAGSSNPLGVSGNYDRISFAPYYLFKDLITIFMLILGLSIFVFFMPNVLGDSENYIMANPMQTPPAIVPEWYLLPFYAILRSIPNKLLGVIAMFSAILAIMLLPITDLGRSKGFQFRPLSKGAFGIFGVNFLILMQLGACHVESPYILLGQISTALYFSYFVVIVPAVSLLENTLVDLNLSKVSFTYNLKLLNINKSSLVFKRYFHSSIIFNSDHNEEKSTSKLEVASHISDDSKFGEQTWLKYYASKIFSQKLQRVVRPTEVKVNAEGKCFVEGQDAIDPKKDDQFKGALERSLKVNSQEPSLVSQKSLFEEALSKLPVGSLSIDKWLNTTSSSGHKRSISKNSDIEPNHKKPFKQDTSDINSDGEMPGPWEDE